MFIDAIQNDEVRSILLNLNLDLSLLILDDYLEVHYVEQGADSSRTGESFGWDQFKQLYLLILRNQSTFFRELYNGKRLENINLQEHL